MLSRLEARRREAWQQFRNRRSASNWRALQTAIQNSPKTRRMQGKADQSQHLQLQPKLEVAAKDLSVPASKQLEKVHQALDNLFEQSESSAESAKASTADICQSNRDASIRKTHGKVAASNDDIKQPLLDSSHFMYSSDGDADPTRVQRKIHVRAGQHTLSPYEQSVIDHQRTFLDRMLGNKPGREVLYTTNELKSTRYEWWNFVPINLYEQLAPWIKPANFYFVCIAVLQAIPAVSTTGGRPTILIPLLFVLIVTAVKDWIEDYARYKQDKTKNSAIYERYKSPLEIRDKQARQARTGAGSWEHIQSKDILVGDIIRITENHRIPADCLLLASGIEKGTHAYVDTKELDGETNLKHKIVPASFLGNDGIHTRAHGKRKRRLHDKALPSLGFSVSCDAANGDLNEWSAQLSSVHYEEDDNHYAEQSTQSTSPPSASADSEHLTVQQLLLTDCVLRNTSYVIGLVAYTGDDTKIRQNMIEKTATSSSLNRPKSQKYSSIFRLTKQLFIAMLTLQFALCCYGTAVATLNAMGVRVWGLSSGGFHWYMQYPPQTLEAHRSDFDAGKLVLEVILPHFATWFIVCKDFIPISLYVSLELVQFWQAMLIGLDTGMSTRMSTEEQDSTEAITGDDDDCNTNEGIIQPTIVQSSRLNEELSQVLYVFSDKTGTLTRNYMDFRKCLIGNCKGDEKSIEQFGHGTTEAGVLRDLKRKQLGDDGELDLDAAFEKWKRGRREQIQSGKVYVHNHVDFDDIEAIRECVKLSRKVLERRQADRRISLTDEERRALEVRDFLTALALNNSVFTKLKLPKQIQEMNAGEEGGEDDDALKDDVDSSVGRSLLGKMRSTMSSLTSVAEVNALTTEDEEDADDENSLTKEQQEAFRKLVSDANSGVQTTLSSSSPDELALVLFAAACGFEIYSREGKVVTLRIADDVAKTERKRFVKYEELQVFEFMSKRKCMTVFVRELNTDGSEATEDNRTGDDNIHIYTKGADSAIAKLLSNDELKSSAWSKTVFKKLEEFGGESLRTLMFAANHTHDISWFEDTVHKPYQHALENQTESEKGHLEGHCSDECSLCAQENVAEHASELAFLGVSAIEDKLQPNVPATLRQLRAAGIHLWMLTGDNLNTAINIAISCNLLEANMENEGRLLRFDESKACDYEQLSSLIEQAEKVLKRESKGSDDAGMLETITVANASEYSDSSSAKHDTSFGLALHGNVFKLLVGSGSENDDEPESDEKAALISRFFAVCSQCHSIIASRLEPREKAKLITMVTEWHREQQRKVGDMQQQPCTTLAIGDGNNDTMMLQQATIGVAVQSRAESNSSALSAADYVIPEFQHIAKLLLVHGHLNYRRVATLILYIFYKTSIVVWSLFLFGHASQFSGQNLYLDYLTQLYNVLFTASPILVFAIFDSDFLGTTLMKFPQMFSITRQHNGAAQPPKRSQIEAEKRTKLSCLLDTATSVLTSPRKALKPSMLPLHAPLFSVPIFCWWMFTGICHAFICFYVTWWSFDATQPVRSSGQTDGIASLGLTLYTCIVIVANMKLVLLFASWTILHHATLWLTIVVYFGMAAIFSSHSLFAVGGIDYYRLLFLLLNVPAFYAAIVLSVSSCILFDYIVLCFQRSFVPSLLDLYMERERSGMAVEPLAIKHAEMLKAEEHDRVKALYTSEPWHDVDKAQRRPPAGDFSQISMGKVDKAVNEYAALRRYSEDDALNRPQVAQDFDRQVSEPYTGYAFEYTPRYSTYSDADSNWTQLEKNAINKARSSSDTGHSIFQW